MAKHRPTEYGFTFTGDPARALIARQTGKSLLRLLMQSASWQNLKQHTQRRQLDGVVYTVTKNFNLWHLHIDVPYQNCVGVMEAVYDYFNADVSILFNTGLANLKPNTGITAIPPPDYESLHYLFEDPSEVFQVILEEGGRGGASIFSSFNGIFTISEFGHPQALACVRGRFGTAYHGEVSEIDEGGKTRRIDLTHYLGTIDFVGMPYTVGFGPAILRKPTPPPDTRTADEQSVETARKWNWENYGLYSREQGWQGSGFGGFQSVDGINVSTGTVAEKAWIAFDDAGKPYIFRIDTEYFGTFGVPGAYLVFKVILVAAFGEILGTDPTYGLELATLTLPVEDMGLDNISNIFYEYVYVGSDPQSMFVSPSEDGRTALVNVYSSFTYGATTCQLAGRKPLRALLQVDISGTVNRGTGEGLTVDFITKQAKFLPTAGPTYSETFIGCGLDPINGGIAPIFDNSCDTTADFEIYASDSIAFEVVRLLRGGSNPTEVSYYMEVTWDLDRVGSMSRTVTPIPDTSECNVAPTSEWSGSYSEELTKTMELTCSAGGTAAYTETTLDSGGLSWNAGDTLYNPESFDFPYLLIHSSVVWVGKCRNDISGRHYSDFKGIAYTGLVNTDSPAEDEQSDLPRYHPERDEFSAQSNSWI